MPVVSYESDIVFVVRHEYAALVCYRNTVRGIRNRESIFNFASKPEIQYFAQRITRSEYQAGAGKYFLVCSKKVIII